MVKFNKSAPALNINPWNPTAMNSLYYSVLILGLAFAAQQGSFQGNQSKYSQDMMSDLGEKTSVSGLESIIKNLTPMEEELYDEMMEDPEEEEEEREDELGCLGHGKYGSVWIVRSSLLGTVARKVLSIKANSLSSSSMVRLEKEITVASQVANHFLFAELIRWSFDDNNIYMDFELLSGNSIQSLLDQGAPLPEAVVRHFGAQILAAIEYLDQQNIVHCDLNPGNVLLTESGQVKIIDFGLSVRSGEWRDLRYGCRLGVAPFEVFDGPVDSRADIWSWGILVFMMACNRFPFDEATDPDHKKHRWHLIASLSIPLQNCARLALELDVTKRPRAAVLKEQDFFKNHIDWNNINNIQLEDAQILEFLSEPSPLLEASEIMEFQDKVHAREKNCTEERHNRSLNMLLNLDNPLRSYDNSIQ